MSSELNKLLKPLRDKIDAIDHQILDLLNQRAQTAIEVGKVKHAYDADDAVLKPEREAQLIGVLQKDNLYGTFPNTSVEAVWTEIVSACRGLERGLTVAYLGPQALFLSSAYEFYGHAVQMLSVHHLMRCLER